MTLQRREKILAGAAGGLMLALAVWFLFFSGGNLSYTQLSAHRDQLTLDVAKKEHEVRAAAKAAKRLAEWQHCALPSDVAEARVQYQAWLRELADRLEFKQPTVDATGIEAKPDVSSLLKFKVHGRTNITKLIEFLHEFYSAGHLHQIRLLDVSTVPNSPEIDVNIDVEAMSLPGADRKSKLTADRGKRLGNGKLSDYTDVIVKRDLFSPFHPVGMPPDMAQTTFITAILAWEGRGEVWLVDRTSGKDWKLHEGEPVDVGLFRGTVKSIGANDAIFEIDGKARRYRSGDNLRGGAEIQKQ
jgi:hypothetical protein